MNKDEISAVNRAGRVAAWFIIVIFSLLAIEVVGRGEYFMLIFPIGMIGSAIYSLNSRPNSTKGVKVRELLRDEPLKSLRPHSLASKCEINGKPGWIVSGVGKSGTGGRFSGTRLFITAIVFGVFDLHSDNHEVLVINGIKVSKSLDLDNIRQCKLSFKKDDKTYKVVIEPGELYKLNKNRQLELDTSDTSRNKDVESAGVFWEILIKD